MKKRLDNISGFTLVELILVIIIFGILVSVAMRSVVSVNETARVEETKKEMEAISFAVSGNPELENNGVRTDFGYVGDVGALPGSLADLNNNPGGFSSWNGPYLKSEFEQDPNNYLIDAWGATYSFDGLSVISSGSGSSISKVIASTSGDLLLNSISGNIYDNDGTPPGNDYKDSLSVKLTIPNGSGSYLTKTASVDLGGYFSFDSIPIGNHSLRLIYSPSHDTLNRFVSVTPKSDLYGEYLFSDNLWYTTGGGGSPGAGTITYISNSDTLGNAANCNNLYYTIENTTGADIVISSLILSWSSPTAYFSKLEWNGTTVYNGASSGIGSGETVFFSSPQTIYDGSSVVISNLIFKQNPGSGPNVDMSGTVFTVTLSDGSTFSFTADQCNN